LQFDGALGYGDDFGAELYANCGVMVELELPLQELQQHAALAHALLDPTVLVSPITISLNR
jgi:hypothetical protein